MSNIIALRSALRASIFFSLKWLFSKTPIYVSLGVTALVSIVVELNYIAKRVDDIITTPDQLPTISELVERTDCVISSTRNVRTGRMYEIICKE